MLSHVAHMVFDLVLFTVEIKTQAVAGARIRRQQAAQHTNGGRFTATIRAEKATNLAGINLQREIVNHVAIAKILIHILDADSQPAHDEISTVTGIPGCKSPARLLEALASMRKISFSLRSLL